MTERIVPVTAEWALWGKLAEDAGYRLLNCSAGTISRENFGQVLTRYSPGTLESLPEVTISWLSDQKPGTDYLAIAIHDKVVHAGATPRWPDSSAAEPARFDAGGREIVWTSYYCVPFRELAQEAVSYSAMYDGFRATQLPVDLGSAISAKLAVAGLGPPPGELAMRVAAMLLTGRPVCILGAGHLPLRERLWFLDAVAALLPYGMRSRLSASTWASSTYQSHRLRLFFASAPRPRDDRRDDDHLVTWKHADPRPIGDPYADDYLNWLRRDAGDRVARLADATHPMSFARLDVLRMLERMGIYEPGTVTQTSPEILTQQLPASPGGVKTVLQLLWSCGDQLDDGDPALNLWGLEQHLGDNKTEELCRKYQTIIQERRLLRADLPVNQGIQAQFYDVLLRLAFPARLTYGDYQRIEDCVGVAAGQPLHLSLLLAIAKSDLEERLMRPLMRVLRQREKSPQETIDLATETLVSLAAEPTLRPEHARIVYDALRRQPEANQPALQLALIEHGYLAQAIQLRHAGDFLYQTWVLHDLLSRAYGSKLDKSAAREILRNPNTVTTALADAVFLNMEVDERLHRTFVRMVSGNRWPTLRRTGNRQARGSVLAPGGKENIEHIRPAKSPGSWYRHIDVIAGFIFLLGVLLVVIIIVMFLRVLK